tara:strand:+ start:826 stop:1377 length:552 start_codon:yes stop_codon:yes gene_type:complete
MGLKVRKDGEWVPISGVGAPGPTGPPGPTGNPSNVPGPPGPSSTPACVSGSGSGQTNNTSYQDIVSVTITPTQSNSKMLIIATGSVHGNGGSGGASFTTATAQITRDTTQIGYVTEARGVTRPFTQTILDDNDHGGNNVTYKLRLKDSAGAFNIYSRMGGARAYTDTNAIQGNATITVLEILQ